MSKRDQEVEVKFYIQDKVALERQLLALERKHESDLMALAASVDWSRDQLAREIGRSIRELQVLALQEGWGGGRGPALERGLSPAPGWIPETQLISYPTRAR